MENSPTGDRSRRASGRWRGLLSAQVSLKRAASTNRDYDDTAHILNLRIRIAKGPLFILAKFASRPQPGTAGTGASDLAT